jgi:hypothetical protein
MKTDTSFFSPALYGCSTWRLIIIMLLYSSPVIYGPAFSGWYTRRLIKNNASLLQPSYIWLLCMAIDEKQCLFVPALLYMAD